MMAFTEKLCQRETTFYGTTGQLRCYSEAEIEYADFSTGKKMVIACPLPPSTSQLQAHGGADFFLMKAFVKALVTGDESHIQTSAQDALASHMLVFAAERARVTRQTEELN
eukprot:TRINITY_DN12368_c0_g1_i1.p6 TRINITY_DN12368_c0_g1~~TRINITY_DN12368_c0_g1_i1.p6  ORF type:complete len:111 (+),score=26.24 TRINITY_DN12368_c0_g1_i1:831-1163(+)